VGNSNVLIQEFFSVKLPTKGTAYPGSMELERLTETFMSHVDVWKQLHLNQRLAKTLYKLWWKRKVKQVPHKTGREDVEWIQLAENGQPMRTRRCTFESHKTWWIS
jgi:hypothetical protein